MEVLIAAEVVVGTCLAVALLILAFVFVRRRLLARGGDLMLCALRPEAQARWTAGLLRCEDVLVAWFPLLGFRLRPDYCWDRQGLDLTGMTGVGPNEPLDAGSVRAVLTGTPIGRGPARVELALAQDPYTALRAWIEATPPERRPVDW